MTSRQRSLVAAVLSALLMTLTGVATGAEFPPPPTESSWSVGAATWTPGQTPPMGLISDTVNAAALQTSARVTGAGITIAVVDTGIDPAHVDLASLRDGRQKIVDWIDTSGEGRVATTTSAQLGGGWVWTPLGFADLRVIRSASGTIWFGILRESDLQPRGGLGQDLDRNGRTTDQFLVVVSDPNSPGHYDTVHVDTERALRLGADSGMLEYRRRGQVGWFGPRHPFRPATAFCISRISADGRSVTIGFDGNGHGTHVAAIAAASGAGSGGMDGIAPGSQLLAVKALGSSGLGGWSQIEQGIRAACAAGADIVCISMTALEPDSGPDEALLRELSRQYGVLFIIAAGNSGPGLGSAAFSSDLESSLVVGGYMPRAVWRAAYGYEVPADTLWYFSAVGPGPSGGLGPDLVAPAAAVAAAPSWEGQDSYDLREGSSMAVPHAAGVAALLLEAAHARGMTVTPRRLRDALCRGARPLTGYLPAEQGHGAVDALKSWDWLRTLGSTAPDSTPVAWSVTVPGHATAAGGLYSREVLAASARVNVQSLWQHRRLVLESPGSWLVPDRAQLNLSAGVRREFGLAFDLPNAPGLYGGVLRGIRSGYADLELPVTVVLPHDMRDYGLRWLRIDGQLGSGRWRREYLLVPPGARNLDLQLTVPRAAGRVRMHVLGPDGGEVYLSPFVGAPESGSAIIVRSIRFPAAGVWEVITYSSAALSVHGLQSSQFTLEARAEHLAVVDPEGGRFSAERPFVGGEWRQTITVTNAGSSMMVEPVAFGGTGRATPKLTERLTLVRSSSVTRELPEVPSGTRLLRVTIDHPSDDDADLDLYVYRQDQVTRDWREVARSAAAGRSGEFVDLLDPWPGRYVAYVDARKQVADAVQFILTASVVPGGGTIAELGERRWLGSGQTLSLTVGGSAPVTETVWTSLLGLRDIGSTGLAAVIPVTVDFRRAELSVDLLPGILAPDTRIVTVSVRDGAGRPVDTVVRVNGSLAYCRRGTVLVPVTPTAGEVRIRVEIDDPRFRHFAREFIITERRYDAPLVTPHYLKPMLRTKMQHRL